MHGGPLFANTVTYTAICAFSNSLYMSHAVECIKELMEEDIRAKYWSIFLSLYEDIIS